MAFAVMSASAAVTAATTWNTAVAAAGSAEYMSIQLAIQNAVNNCGSRSLLYPTRRIDSAARTRLVSTDLFTLTDQAGGMTLITW